MKAVEITAPGPPDVLKIVERPDPVPAADEILIDVAAAGVNRPDVLQRLGKYPVPPGVSDIPGLEVAGVVAALGKDVRGWAVGDPVCALLAGGGYAELAAAPQEQCLPVPKGLTMAEAAGIPETFFTVWTNVFDRGRLAAGEWLLVHGGTSGIGTTAIQLAVARGSQVLATAGTDDKCRAVEALGAKRCINYKSADFVAGVKDITGGRGVDVILDIIGGEYAAKNLECLNRDGRLVQIGLMGGADASISLRLILLKRLTVTGSTLRIRTPAEKGAIAASLEREVWPLLESGSVKPVISATYPLARAADAHRHLESGAVIGKVVLTA